MNFWNRIALFILQRRKLLLIGLGITTAIMVYFALQTQITNEFNRSIPLDNPKFADYLDFKKKFGEDGNVMVLGIEHGKLANLTFFNNFKTLITDIKQIDAVEEILASPLAINISKDSSSGKFTTYPVFKNEITNQTQLDSLINVYHSLKFYRGLLYNPSTEVELVAIKIKKNVMNTTRRSEIVEQILECGVSFEKANTGIKMHYSGLPLLRTQIAKKLSRETALFTILSLLLTTCILFLFFRSFSVTFFSLIVVLIGVAFTFGSLVIMGYKLTLLTALVPTLIVVIGIPNCVYLINKYHTEYNKLGDKMQALVAMIEKMGIVTLFTNLTAAIGFGVFIFTKSLILKEFGLIAGLNIIFIFIISLIFIPSVFSFLPAPSDKHTDYLENKWLTGLLDSIERWVFGHRKSVYIVSFISFVISLIGIFKLETFGYVIDDLPKDDELYIDMRFFEKNFNGVLPFEILIDAKKKGKASQPAFFIKVDKLEKLLAQHSVFGKPLSLSQGIKFATQAYFNGDSNQYRIPTDPFEQAFIYGALLKNNSNQNKNVNVLAAFLDSTKQVARISVNMKDIGSKELPLLIDSLRPQVDKIFDTAKYKVTFTGTSIIFLEGSRFITNGLRDSLILAFLTIILCMLWLFKSWRLLLISLIPNILPLVITAGIMGFMGIHLKPSTVLIFSISLGIAIDVTIRFLVNYKQELAHNNYEIDKTVIATLHDTGVSIIYTSLILFAGFFIFCVSGFGGTVALGLLTSLTLILSMITNLTLLPSLLMWLDKMEKKKSGSANN
jgi:predicted RND superfamily exporter protein